MIFIGIDIAKNTHFASAVNSDGEILVILFHSKILKKDLIYFYLNLRTLI